LTGFFSLFKLEIRVKNNLNTEEFMKKYLWFSAAAFALVGCGERADSNWTYDCVKHHSETGREFAKCKDMVRKQAQKEEARRYAAQEQAAPAQRREKTVAQGEATFIPEGAVTVDKENTSIQSFNETGKRTRNPETSPDEK
jgi:Tfp pilus assembly protein PilP